MILAEVQRAQIVESVHRGRVALVNPSGEMAWHTGAVDAPFWPRSAVKPLQATAMLSAGWDGAGEQLALACASHLGEDEHVRLAQQIVHDAGRTLSDLQCVPDTPGSRDAWRALIERGQPDRTRERMNCSGKHAAMIATCARRGWPIETYRDPDHPLQRHIRKEIERLSGDVISAVTVDGCGAPLFAITVAGLARSFAALMRAANAGDDSPEARVVAAMCAYPHLVRGTGDDNTRVMQMLPGLIAKLGAEGVMAMAAPNGWAVAIKMDDGSTRAATMVGLEVLSATGFDTAAARELMSIAVLGHGKPVGEIRVCDELRADLRAHLAHQG